MIGITLTADQIRNAPAEVRRWIEQEVIASLRLAPSGLAPKTGSSRTARPSGPAACNENEIAAIFAQLRGMPAALNVLFEFRQPGIAFGDPPLKSFRLMDIMHNGKLQNIEQVMVGLNAINTALSDLRGALDVRFCEFDNEGHCFLAPETQTSIAKLWHHVVVSQQPTAVARHEPMPHPN